MLFSNNAQRPDGKKIKAIAAAAVATAVTATVIGLGAFCVIGFTASGSAQAESTTALQRQSSELTASLTELRRMAEPSSQEAFTFARDPMIPLTRPGSWLDSDPGPAASSTGEGAQTVAGHILQGVLYDQNTQIAIIDGKDCKEGQTVDDYRVVKINPVSVVLEINGVQETLRLYSASEESLT